MREATVWRAREEEKEEEEVEEEDEAEDERVGTFHSLSQQKGPPGGFANRNRRPWSVYEFPQLGTGDKQIASYFCIQRLNGRRVWNDAAPRYRPTIIGEPASTSEEFQRAPQPDPDLCVCFALRVCARARYRPNQTAPSSPSFSSLPFRTRTF